MDSSQVVRSWGRLFNLFGPQFLPFQNAIISSTYLAQLWALMSRCLYEAEDGLAQTTRSKWLSKTLFHFPFLISPDSFHPTKCFFSNDWQFFSKAVQSVWKDGKGPQRTGICFKVGRWGPCHLWHITQRSGPQVTSNGVGNNDTIFGDFSKDPKRLHIYVYISTYIYVCGF